MRLLWRGLVTALAPALAGRDGEGSGYIADKDTTGRTREVLVLMMLNTLP